MTALVTKHVSKIADSPKGIQQLRNLILDLAIRGKLVPQNPSDSTAKHLLAAASAARSKLMSSRKLIFKPVRNTSSTESLPIQNGWVWTTLAEIALINPRNNVDDSLVVSFVPMTLIGAKFDSGHKQENRKWAEVKQGFTHFAEDDIGIAKITPCFENSKACVFTQLSNGFGAGTTELHVVRPLANALVPRYVLAYVKSPFFLKTGETKMIGTAGQKRLPKDFVESHPFPLPPLAEQHRIVAKVDELMSLCDRLEANQADAEAAHTQLVKALLDSLTQATDAADFRASWQRLSEHFHTLFTTEASIDALKQAVLQLGVMGKLVGQCLEEGTAESLIASLKLTSSPSKNLKSTIRLSSEKKVNIEPIFFLPSNWCWVRFGDICEIKGGKRLPIGASFSLEKTPYVYIQVTNMKYGTILDNGLKYISEETRNRIHRYTISSDDLYITIAGTIGEVGTVPAHFNNMNLTENAAKIVFETIDKPWLAMVLSSGFAKSQFLDRVNKLAQPKLALHRIAETIIALPPLAEQQRIVGKVEDLMHRCDQLKTQLISVRQHQIETAKYLVESE